jgi:hydroxypyruvate isomerase
LINRSTPIQEIAMPRFAANLTMLFTELPFLERFAAASKAHFKAVEFLFPYEYAVDELHQRLKVNGLQLVLHNLPAGNWAAGERASLVCPIASMSSARVWRPRSPTPPL